MMRVHVLEREQWLPIPLHEAWSFFSTPHNLGHITPPAMRFTIHPPFDDAPVHTGQHIRYSVRPLFGIPLQWETLIGEVDAPHRFVDEQLKGPFTLWQHTHTFLPEADGTLMRDLVRYALPLGPLGNLAHALLVKRKVQDIFAFRRKALDDLFPLKAT